MAASDRPAPLAHPGHYENFPVASVLLPRRLRAPVRAIYAFARAADDLADEGNAAPEVRLASLRTFTEGLHAIEAGETPSDPIFSKLAETVRTHHLPLQPFHDLLDAFTQDVSKTRYADFGEVMTYCRRSANPVGQLLLALYGDTEPKHRAWSDGICSALQLINFLQDIALDWHKGRVYLPQDEMAQWGITEAQIAAGKMDALWSVFMQHQVERARRMLQAGAPLGLALKGRIGLEMRLIILGGERILFKIARVRGDVFTQRPTLHFIDWIVMLHRALRPRRQASRSCRSGRCQ